MATVAGGGGFIDENSSPAQATGVLPVRWLQVNGDDEVVLIIEGSLVAAATGLRRL